MVVSPMDALWDVAQYWKQLGGVWYPSDAIHFEYPGFKEDLASGALFEKGSLSSTADLIAGVINPELGAVQAVSSLIPGSETLKYISELPGRIYSASPGRKIDEYILSLFGF